MGIYDDLDNFNLISHGDRREQEWGSLVSQRFPAYETLWNRYVVPLTNRIDPKILLIQTFREPLGLTQHAKRLLPLFVCKCYAGAVYGLAEFWRTTTLRTTDAGSVLSLNLTVEIACKVMYDGDTIEWPASQTTAIADVINNGLESSPDGYLTVRRSSLERTDANRTFETEMTISFRAFRKSTICAVICLVLVGGCVNLDDIAQLTKLAGSAQQTLPLVVADIPASCQRQNLLLNDIPSQERPPDLLPQDCKAFQDVADHLTKDQNVLIAYFDALGKLASNTPLSYGQTIDTNVTTIGKLPSLSKDTISASTAAQGIAKVLGDIVTQGYRAKKLNSIILTTDDAVQRLTVDLKKVVAVEYVGILSDESELVDTYYQSPIAARGQSERLALIVVQRQYHSDTTALNARKNAADAYGKVMDSFASLHGKLKVEAAKKASLSEIAKEIGPDISNLKDAISKLQTEHR